MSRLLLFAGLLSVLLCCSCRTVPFSDRQQLLLTSDAEEQALGASAYSEYKKEFPVSTKRDYTEALNRVGRAIQKVAARDDYKWEFVVLASDTANAFCLPGGKVAVYSGLFQFVANDAELATVVSHEIAHALARHGGERMSMAQLQQLGSLGLKKAGVGTVGEAVYGYGTQLGVMLPFSRKHEHEADTIGLVLMAKAGYQPEAAIAFSKFGGEGPSSIIEKWTSTHPGGDDRIKLLQETMSQALEEYNRAPTRYGLGQAIK